jgi:hypothetical protein
MKNIVIIVLFSLLHTISVAQTNCSQDSVIYLAAYNYIFQDSVNQGKTITVSDSIVDLDKFWFSQDISDCPAKKEVLDQYRANKGFIWFDTYYSPCLASLFCKTTTSKNVLFFSKIEDNMLRADLLPYKQQSNKFDYGKMAFQNVGQIYLFIFNKDGSLKSAFSHEIIYD